MRRQFAAVLLGAALWLSACGTAVAPQSSAAETVPDLGRELTITSIETVIDEVGDESLKEVELEGRVFGQGDEYVVLAHMQPADMNSWFDFARLLANEGYTAMAFNFRGYGESESGENGEPAIGDDVRAAVDAAFDDGATKVYVVGASMGGTGAVAASATRDVAGAVALSAPDEFAGVSAVGLADLVDTPLLLVAADGDGTAADDAAAIAAAAQGETELVVLTGGQHGTNLFTEHGAELTELILGFLAAS